MYNIWGLMKKKYFENWKLKKQLVFIMKLKIFCWIIDNIKYKYLKLNKWERNIIGAGC